MPEDTHTPGLVLENVSKEFPYPGGIVHVLDSISLTVSRGETIAVVGPSGSGKSTLLNIIGSLDSPTSGSVEFEGENISKYTGSGLAEFRNKKIGFVFQDHHLLPQCTALENVLVPTLPSGSSKEIEQRGRELLEKVDLKDRISFFPAQLSGGERQRVAVARALINEPVLLLCDEPTGNLDPESSDMIISLLQNISQEGNLIRIIVTHNMELAQSLPRVYELKNGSLRKIKK